MAASAPQLPLIVILGRQARARFGIEPFSPEHMALLDSGALDLWLRIAAEELWSVVRCEIGLHDFGADGRDDALTWVCHRLWKKCAAGVFSDSVERSAASWVRTAVRNLARDWRRREVARNQRQWKYERRAVAEQRNGAMAMSTHQEDLRGQRGEEAQSERTRARIATWRSWPLGALPRLVLGATVFPAEVELEDVMHCFANARLLKVTLRDPEEAWELLQPWLADHAEGRDPGDLGLAFALRGPVGVLRLDHWHADEGMSAVRWVWKLRERAQTRLAAKLGGTIEV